MPLLRGKSKTRRGKLCTEANNMIRFIRLPQQLQQHTILTWCPYVLFLAIPHPSPFPLSSIMLFCHSSVFISFFHKHIYSLKICTFIPLQEKAGILLVSASSLPFSGKWKRAYYIYHISHYGRGCKKKTLIMMKKTMSEEPKANEYRDFTFTVWMLLLFLYLMSLELPK